MMINTIWIITPLEKLKDHTNKEDAELIHKFYWFMKCNSSGENHITDNIKSVLNFEVFSA